MLKALWNWLFPVARIDPPHIKWPELVVIHDSLLNEPKSWREDFLGTLYNDRLSVQIDNATRFHSLGLEIKVGAHRIETHGMAGGSYIRSAISGWMKIKSDAAANRLIQTDHTLRVERVMQARALLMSDEAKDILSKLD